MQPLPNPQPELTTERLLLRALCKEDAPALAKIANDPDIAKYLSSMPYPYSIEDAHKFIASRAKAYAENDTAEFAVVEKASGALMGIAMMDLNPKDNHATLGYWLGKNYWGRGYATEAVQALLHFSFETLGLHRITAHRFGENEASGKVLLKAGLKLEGRRREHFKKGEIYHDVVDYGILAREYYEKHNLN